MNSRVHHINVNSVVGLAGSTDIAVELFSASAKPDALLFCFPGGGCNRHYFNLQVEDDSTYSFARSAAQGSVAVAIVDHLGTGDSTIPNDGFDVTVERIIAANAVVVEQICEALGEPELVVGVGHSMGAMLAILQQDTYASFSALALLGFGNSGMADQLNEFGRTLASENNARLHNVQFARETFPQGYFDIDLGEGRKDSGQNPAAIEALKRGRGDLLAVPGSLTLIPGCVARETARIEVPTFLALGDRDLCGPVEEVATEFSRCTALTTCTLADTGHMHFIYPSRAQLMLEFSNWLEQQ